jgi:hypothetical protein
MITAGFFFLSFSIFLMFGVLITLLGYFFQCYLFKVFRLKKISLTILLESFGIGTVIFIFYSYFIIDFLRVFNFFTIYLPLVIFDSINLFYTFYKRKSFSKNNLQKFIEKSRNFISDKQVKRHIAILIIIYSLLLLVQGVIETHLNLPSKDPYTWVDIILYLHRYGDLNYDNYTVHGVGFAIFIAGSLLITGNFYIQYFYIKYISIFFFSIIILAIYNISSWFFKKDIEILITLIILLCFNSLLIRFSFAVPSIIATTLGILFFNTLTQKDDMRILLIRGLLLGGMFLTHPLYFLLLFVYLIFYELFLLIQNIKENLKKKENKLSEIIFDFIRKYGIILSISVIITIPYFLNLFISGKSLYKNFTRYLFRGYNANIHNQFNKLQVSASLGLNFINLNPSKTDFLYNLIFFGFDIPINKTLNWGVIFIILGLFWNTKWSNQQKKYLINFIKFTFIFTFMIFIINSFLFIIDNVMILSLASFINQYVKRVFELFSPAWSILFILGVLTPFKFIKKIKTKKIKGYAITKENLITELEKRYDKAYLIVLIVLGASLYSSHLYFQYNLLYTSHYEDDHLTDALLYIGDYFNSEDIEDKTILLPDNFDSKVIFRLLYHRNLKREYLEFDNTNYTELMIEIDVEDVDFVLVYKLETRESCLNKIDERQDVLYENPNYLFFKVK